MIHLQADNPATPATGEERRGERRAELGVDEVVDGLQHESIRRQRIENMRRDGCVMAKLGVDGREYVSSTSSSCHDN